MEKLFRLPFEFIIPNLLFEKELIDLGIYTRDDIHRFGLRVEVLDPVVIQKAQSYQAKYGRLSLADCLAFALASGEGRTLLTGDKALRAVSETEGIEVHGVLWLVDHMHNSGLLSAGHLREVLVAMRDDPRCYVPVRELTLRIQQLPE